MTTELFEQLNVIDAIRLGDLAQVKAIIYNPKTRISIEELQQGCQIAIERKHREIVALLKTRISLTEMLPDLNLFEVSRLFELCNAAIEEARDKELTIVIGNTGSGKSTLINKLNGCRYQSKKPNIATLVSGHEVTKTQAGGGSCTLVPKIIPIQINGKTLNLCDLPGFDDNRSIERKIVAANAVHMVSQVCRSIQAVAIVVPLGNFTSHRGASLRHVADILSTILRSNSEETNKDIILNSLYFIITQIDPYNISIDEILSNYVQSILRTSDGQGLLDRKNNLNAEEKRILKSLSIIIQCKNRILISNTLDDGESAQSILTKLAACKPQYKECFNFTNLNPNQDKFRSIVLPKLTSLYSQKKIQIVEHDKKLARLDRDCDELRDEIRKNQAILEQKRSELRGISTNTKIDTSTLEKEQDDLKANTKAEQERVVNLQGTLAEAQTQILELSTQLSEANKLDLVEVWSDRFESVAVVSYREIKKLMRDEGEYVWTNVIEVTRHLDTFRHTFEFEAGYPLHSWEILECQHGSFNRGGEGQWSAAECGAIFERVAPHFWVNFEYTIGYRAKAAVRVFALTKDLPKNQELSRGLQMQLDGFREWSTEIEADINLCRSKIDECQRTATQNISLLEKLRNEQIENLIKNTLRREHLQTEIEKIEKKRIPADEKKLAFERNQHEQLCADLDELELELKANHELFDIVMKISTLLGVTTDDLSVQPHKIARDNPSQNQYSFHQSPRSPKSPKSPVIDRSWYTDEKINLLLARKEHDQLYQEEEEINTEEQKILF